MSNSTTFFNSLNFLHFVFVDMLKMQTQGYQRGSDSQAGTGTQSRGACGGGDSASARVCCDSAQHPGPTGRLRRHGPHRTAAPTDRHGVRPLGFQPLRPLTSPRQAQEWFCCQVLLLLSPLGTRLPRSPHRRLRTARGRGGDAHARSAETGNPAWASSDNTYQEP